MGLRIANGRADERNPYSGRCPLALRRICGVCRHFTGEKIRDIGGCAHFGYGAVDGRMSAGDCEIWERPTVAPGETTVTRPTLPGGVTTTKTKTPRCPPSRNPNYVPLAERLLQYPVLAKQGLSLSQAGKRLGVGRGTIVRDLAARGLQWSVLRDGEKPAPSATLDGVARAVAQVWGLDIALLRGRGGDGCENARAVAYVLAQDMAQASNVAIGVYFDGRHAKSIASAVKRGRRDLLDKYADQVSRARDLAKSDNQRRAA